MSVEEVDLAASAAAERDRPPPIRVIRVLGSLDTGGAEQRAIELIPRLVAAGVIPHFVTLSGRKGSMAPVAEQFGAHVHPLPIDARFPLRFLRLIRQLRPRAVHSEVATFSGVPLLLAALAGRPVRIAHFHNDGDGHPDTLRRRWQRAVMRKLISTFATDIIGVAPGTLTHLYRRSWESDARCRVLANGHDLDRLRQPSAVNLRATVAATPGELLCLCVCRPAPVKRRPMVPAIIAALGARGIAARAVLVGPRDRVDDREVLAAARAHGVADRVHLLGPRDDVGGLLRQADLLLHPAEREGLPGTVLEALALGTPVVAADLPGIRFIRDHLPGLTTLDVTAPAQDWAEAVQTLGLRPGQGHDVEEAVRRFEASVFSLTTAAEQHLAMYTRSG
ncbi:glycosyltransferase [Micromonospora soli]|uniref:glycosyltransferase n=1 Tax=Micromonospora sp. NBRC 110009 TaxID=3061627 RepID=UPI002672BDF3|nr:glycosyltransferase [Micromonospora sp. NBRC 110009]WKT99078.1 glycosyltransferase [Micromonospora sp. NBRC 110009]